MADQLSDDLLPRLGNPMQNRLAREVGARFVVAEGRVRSAPAGEIEVGGISSEELEQALVTGAETAYEDCPGQKAIPPISREGTPRLLLEPRPPVSRFASPSRRERRLKGGCHVHRTRNRSSHPSHRRPRCLGLLTENTPWHAGTDHA